MEMKDTETEPLSPRHDESAETIAKSKRMSIEEKEVDVDVDIVYKEDKTVTFQEEEETNKDDDDSLSSSSFGSQANHVYGGDTPAIETPDTDLPPDYDPPITYQYSASTTHTLGHQDSR